MQLIDEGRGKDFATPIKKVFVRRRLCAVNERSIRTDALRQQPSLNAELKRMSTISVRSLDPRSLTDLAALRHHAIHFTLHLKITLDFKQRFIYLHNEALVQHLCVVILPQRSSRYSSVEEQFN